MTIIITILVEILGKHVVFFDYSDEFINNIKNLNNFKNCLQIKDDGEICDKSSSGALFQCK